MLHLFCHKNLQILPSLHQHSMEVLLHHIYEYKKGLRDLVLHTMTKERLPEAEQKLRKQNVCYVLQPVTSNKVNIFFGRKECIEVIKKIGLKPLNKYTPEEDFILGIMLGYDRKLQCERFIKQKQKSIESLEEISLLTIREQSYKVAYN